MGGRAEMASGLGSMGVAQVCLLGRCRRREPTGKRREWAACVVATLSIAALLLLAFANSALAGISVTTIAGHLPSYVDGVGTAAGFGNATAICYGSATGDLYLTDTAYDTIRRMTPAGVVTTVTTIRGGLLGICYDSHDGNLYITGGYMSAVYQVTPAGVVTEVAGGGSPGADGTLSSAGFAGAQGICYDAADGKLYVADSGDETIRQVTPVPLDD